MKKNKNMKERILRVALTFVMLASLLAGMAPMEVHATGCKDTVENLIVEVEKTATPAPELIEDITENVTIAVLALPETVSEFPTLGETPEVAIPEITTQPQGTSVQVGETATFSVTATGEGVSYQWQIDRNDGNGFVDINGATSASYTTSAVDMDCNGFKYKCIVTNEAGSVPSNVVTLTVTANLEPHGHDGISYQPISQNALQNEGNYYLTEDITLNGSITISGTVNLCLNGHVLNASSITVSSGATLNVFDCGTTIHKYKSSNTSYWTPDASGDKVIEGGILCSQIINEGTFKLKEGTICGINGVAINNKSTATIGENGAVIGNYNSTTGYDNKDIPTSIPAIVYNGKGATFSNSGKINNNVAMIHTVCNDGGTFTNERTGTINENTATSTTDGTAAGGVANYTRNTSYISKLHNYGQINNNTSARSSGGVLNKGGEFTNYSTGQINGNVAARHCGGVDNTSNAYSGEYRGTFFKNYGQVNNNKVLASNGGGNGAGIYNEAKAIIYNYGEVCGNTAVGQGGGIFFNDGSGTLIVGGNSKVTGNKDGDGKNSNICVGSGKVIGFDSETPLVDGAIMGVYLYDGGRINGKVSSGYTTLYGSTDVTTYFFADTPTQVVELENQEVYLKTHSHDLELVPAVPATCTKSGNIVYYKCVSGQCTYLFVDENGNTSTTSQEVTIGALGHDMSEVTCTEASKCQRESCNHTEGSALGHDMRAASCTEASKCQREGCNHEGTALGHDMSKASCTEAPKCQRSGCNHEGTALGHDMSKASCTETPKCQREGCNHTEGTALGHDWTGEWTVIREATTTEDGKKETLCVRGCGQNKVVTIPATGASEDNGNVEKDAEVATDAPIDDATLDNSKEELLNAENIFTATEKQEIENGADARVWLEINNIIDIAPTDKDKIEEEAAYIMGENLNITYFDAKLFKQVGTNRVELISDPGIAIKITITIPTELINNDATINREYKILRLHEGQSQVDVISGTFDVATGEFSFETDKFSTYAIVYKDVPVEDTGNSGNNGNNGDTGNTGNSGDNGNVLKPSDEQKDEVPKTGDSNNALYSFALMLISGLGILFCLRRKEVYSKEK